MNFQIVLNNNFKGRNLAEISRELEIPRSLLQDWMNGVMPSLKNLKYLTIIGEYLNLNLNDLLIGSEIASKKKVVSSIQFTDDNRSYRIQIERLD